MGIGTLITAHNPLAPWWQRKNAQAELAAEKEAKEDDKFWKDPKNQKAVEAVSKTAEANARIDAEQAKADLLRAQADAIRNGTAAPEAQGQATQEQDSPAPKATKASHHAPAAKAPQENIAGLQMQLEKLGFATDKGGADGKVDGIRGEITNQAIYKAEETLGLAHTGDAGKLAKFLKDNPDVLRETQQAAKGASDVEFAGSHDRGAPMGSVVTRMEPQAAAGRGV